MTAKQACKVPKPKPAPPDHEIYRPSYVIGGIGRNRLPEGVRKELKRER